MDAIYNGAEFQSISYFFAFFRYKTTYTFTYALNELLSTNENTKCTKCWKGHEIRKNTKINTKSNNLNTLVSAALETSDEKENTIFLTYKEIQKGAVAKSYMTNGLLIHRKKRFTSFPSPAGM
jgi:hypothetical protein